MSTDNIKHYAIYGGSFDPIHMGHLALAGHAVSECGIDKLIFMPAYMSPFKQDKNITSGRDRAAMIEAVLKYNKAFCLSTYELHREGPSYTYETVMHWKRLLGGKLSFILGFDSVAEIDTWYHGQDLLHEVSLITARRPHTDDDEGMNKIQSYKKLYGTEVTVLNMDPVDASSTEIRRRAAAGKPLNGLVTPEIERYITEHDLYKD